MSRTKRKVTEYKWEETSTTTVVDETAAKHKKSTMRGKKMKPYVRSGENFKFEVYEHNGMRNTSHDAKEAVRNANRSLKKALRQKLKRELNKTVKDLGYEI